MGGGTSKHTLLAVALASAAVGVAAGMLTAPLSSHASATGQNARRVLIRKGEIAAFAGTGWTCSLASRPAPPGIAGIKRSLWRRSIFCRYLVDDGGCPFVELANPFLWVADAVPGTLRRGSIGGAATGDAYYVKTHFGCD